MTGIDKLLKNRTPTEVAAALTDDKRICTRQLVEYWAGKKYVTPKWAPVVHRVYGIPLHELNPDVYPRSMSN